MPNELEDSVLFVHLTRMLIGASEKIDIRSMDLNGIEFGLRFEDILQIVDSRILFRILFAFPLSIKPPVGVPHIDWDTIDISDGTCLPTLEILKQAGCQIRLSYDRHMTSSFVVDNNEMIFNNYLKDPPGPFVSSDPKLIARYSKQFDNSWAAAFKLSMREYIYTLPVSSIGPQKESHIAIVSQEAWADLLERLSRNPKLLHDLHPRKFEELVAELLSRDGLEVQLTPQTRDGGRDILAFQRTPVGKLLYLVECKRHNLNRPVGIAIVQRLYGVVAQERATAGLLVSTSRFTKNALSFAATIKHQMGLRDYDSLKDWVRKYGALS